MATTKSARDKIRAATIGSKKVFKKVILEFMGTKIEVRQLTIQERNAYAESALEKKSKKDDKQTVNIMKLQVNAIIQSCYVPGTDDLVFEDTDYNSISESVSGGYADKIWEAVQEMSNITVEDAKKN